MQLYTLGTKITFMELKAELFNSWNPQEDIVNFIKEENIKRENILIITQGAGSYTLFYYV